MGTKLHYGIVDEVDRNVFEVIFEGEEDARGVVQWFKKTRTEGEFAVEGDDDGHRWCVRADLTKIPPTGTTSGITFMALRGFVIGALSGWRMGAEGG